jgi:hypothetical protein
VESGKRLLEGHIVLCLRQSTVRGPYAWGVLCEAGAREDPGQLCGGRWRMMEAGGSV